MGDLNIRQWGIFCPEARSTEHGKD